MNPTEDARALEPGQLLQRAFADTFNGGGWAEAPDWADFDADEQARWAVAEARYRFLLTPAPDVEGLVKEAALNASLPPGYQYGPDALEQVDLGKRIATVAILAALRTARPSPQPPLDGKSAETGDYVDVSLRRLSPRPEDNEDHAANSELVGMIREAAKRVFGGNCTFADDDLRRLEKAATALPACPSVEDICRLIHEHVGCKVKDGDNPLHWKPGPGGDSLIGAAIAAQAIHAFFQQPPSLPDSAGDGGATREKEFKRLQQVEAKYKAQFCATCGNLACKAVGMTCGANICPLRHLLPPDAIDWRKRHPDKLITQPKAGK